MGECWNRWLLASAAVLAMMCSLAASAEEQTSDGPKADVREGPDAALAFEHEYRDPDNFNASRPIRFGECKHVTELNRELWSKKEVLTDFKKHRTNDQVGVIVFVKTEYCCTGSRLCAVTTACLEKKSTPLIGRFRIYGGWIKNHADRDEEAWSEWDRQVVEEYDFIQGPGARIVVMVPLWNGKMYQWQSTATDLELDGTAFDRRDGETPELERFLQTAIHYAPTDSPLREHAEDTSITSEPGSSR